MLLHVRVMPRSRKNEVMDLGQNRLKVRVVSPPVDGKANAELIESLARHFNRPRSSITIKRGASSRDKIVEIADG